MTWIKICGTTNLEDAQLVVEAGADALGFVFYDKSPRKIEPELVRNITATLPAQVEKIGVFVNHTVQQIEEVCATAGLTGIQVCQPDREAITPILDLSKQHKYRLFFSLPGKQFEDNNFSGIFLSKEFTTQLTALMLDSGTPEEPGGTGKTFDWRKARDFVRALSLNLPVIVAGGLTSRNVGEALSLFQPWGVDVASGVEAKLGKKDPEKVRAFIRAVRVAEKNN